MGLPELSLSALTRVHSRTRADLRSAEWIGVVYFVYTAVLSAGSGVTAARLAMAASLPLVILAVAAMEAAYSRPWSRVFRALFPTALILVAYWQLDWFQGGSRLVNLQRTWVAWDRYLLQQWGLRAAVEAFGPIVPLMLETCYLVVYAIPPLSVALLIAFGYGNRVDRYLVTLLTGAFAAYVLLPHFPTVSPRNAFPFDQLPAIETPIRALNVFILDHLDISTSVFPSGHIAVVFSSAWGMWRALPERRWPAWLLLFLSFVVLLATVYGRYHYAADGLASVVLSVAAWRLSQLCDRSA